MRIFKLVCPCSEGIGTVIGLGNGPAPDKRCGLVLCVRINEILEQIVRRSKHGKECRERRNPEGYGKIYASPGKLFFDDVDAERRQPKAAV